MTPTATLAEARAAIADAWFDLLVIDYHLPDGAGTQFVKDVRNALGPSAPPAILITATPDTVPLEELDLFVEVLPKPFKLAHFNHLLEGVRTLVRPARQRSGVVLRSDAVDQNEAKNGTE